MREGKEKYNDLYNNIISSLEKEFKITCPEETSDDEYLHFFVDNDGANSIDNKFLTIVQKASYLAIVIYINENKISEIKSLPNQQIAVHHPKDKTKHSKRWHEVYQIPIVKSNKCYRIIDDPNKRPNKILSKDFDKKDIYHLIKPFIKMSYEQVK